MKSYQRKLEKEVNEERNNNGKDDFDYPDGEILEEKEIINQQQIQKVDYFIKETIKKYLPTQFKHHVIKMAGS